jgi:predicted ester cyclase
VPTIRDKYALENLEELSLPKARRYRPHRDLRFYPGAQLSDERRALLDADALEPDQLTTDDITYKLGRMVTGTLYGLVEQIEERWGKQAAREAVFEWGRRRGRDNIKKWMSARGETHLTPDLWIRFQDYRHLISGPEHAHSFMDADVSHKNGVDTVTLNRTGCLFHTGRPSGMDSYSAMVARGKWVGYADAYPEISCEYGFCMAEGTSVDGCQVLFHIRRQDEPEAASLEPDELRDTARGAQSLETTGG